MPLIKKQNEGMLHQKNVCNIVIITQLHT